MSGPGKESEVRASKGYAYPCGCVDLTENSKSTARSSGRGGLYVPHRGVSFDSEPTLSRRSILLEAREDVLEILQATTREVKTSIPG